MIFIIHNAYAKRTKAYAVNRYRIEWNEWMNEWMMRAVRGEEEVGALTHHASNKLAPMWQNYRIIWSEYRVIDYARYHTKRAIIDGKEGNWRDDALLGKRTTNNRRNEQKEWQKSGWDQIHLDRIIRQSLDDCVVQKFRQSTMSSKLNWMWHAAHCTRKWLIKLRWQDI